MKSPYPYFGGKSRVASEVWARLGDVDHYVEPFFGSGAVLLARPHAPRLETINDRDGFVANFWRAVQADPDGVADSADQPVNEADLHAWHIALVRSTDGLTERLMADPTYFDAGIAGRWVWGVCAWIGSGWCSGEGPWTEVDGVFVKAADAGRGVNRQLPHLGNAGRGVNRQLPHLGDAGRGVNRKLPHLGGAGRGVNRMNTDVHGYMTALATRMRRVRVACGDWSRVCGGSVLTATRGTIGIFLDPPYGAKDRSDVYTHESHELTREVQDFAIVASQIGARVAVCGYAGEYDLPGWHEHAWKAAGGYNSAKTGNASRERIWFSPTCLTAKEAP